MGKHDWPTDADRESAARSLYYRDKHELKIEKYKAWEDMSEAAKNIWRFEVGAPLK